MVSKITQFAGLWWGSCLLFSLTAQGQQTTHPFASKANRSLIPVNTSALKPVVINGQAASVICLNALKDVMPNPESGFRI